MSDPTPTRLLQQSRLAKDQGNQFLTAGLGVGAIGVLGALAGAVCPLCVVATPALLGAGLVRAVWGRHLDRKARSQHAEPPSTLTTPTP